MTPSSLLLRSAICASGISSSGVARTQQRVTQVGERLLLTAAVLAVLAVVYLLMWRSWRRRRTSEQSAFVLAPVPPAHALGAVRARAEGSYVATTLAGDWLARVHAHGLGVRGPADLLVTTSGVLLARPGRGDLFIPAGSVRGVRLDRGMAGTFVEEGGLVVVTWQHDDARYDTGFRPRSPQNRDALVTAVTALTEVRS